MRRLLTLRPPRLQAATVISVVALFVALGGTSYAVTGGTPFTWINGSQLEDHSVTGDKLAPHTISGGALNLAGFPRVPAARIAESATNATTAANATNAVTAVNAVSAQTAQSAQSATTAQTITGKINASQVSGSVANAVQAQSAQTATSAATAQTITGTIDANQVSGPVATANSATNAASATNATNAASATNATNATNATFVDGDQFVNISVSSSSSSDTTLHAIAGLTLSMRCTGGNVDIDATTSVSSASYGMSAVANGAATNFVKAEGNFNTGATVTSTIAAPSQVSFSYQGGGKVASGTLTVYDNGGTCSAFGVAEYS